LGDFIPFLVLASAVAIADIFRRLETGKRSIRVGAVLTVGVVALFSIVANIGIAIVPNEEWDQTQALNYVQAQKTVSDLTGHPLQANVKRGDALPAWAPAGQLYVIGNCSGLYVSNGENYSTVPSEQFTRTTWMTVQLGEPFEHTFSFDVQSPPLGGLQTVPLVQAGKYTVTVTMAATTDQHVVLLWFTAQTAGAGTVKGPRFEVATGGTHTVVVTTDPVKHQFVATFDGRIHVTTTLPLNQEPITVAATGAPNTSKDLSVKSVSTPAPALCQSLIN
jgi:hypothetical protein